MRGPIQKYRPDFRCLLVCLLLLACIGCGIGGDNTDGSNKILPPSRPSPTSVAINIPSRMVQVARAIQLTATVTGAKHQSFIWAVDGIPGGTSFVGTISTSGLYTAPLSVPNPNKVTVTATSTSDSTNTGFADITIAPLTMSYGYDQAGERVFSSNGINTTIYPTKEYNVTSSIPTKHIFANGELIATIQGSGASATTHIINSDHLTGSNIVSDMSGNIQEVLDYYPFGATRLDEQSGFNEQRKFAGHEFDQDTGLSYMDARYYDPAHGRFLSSDAAALITPEKFLTDPQQFNFYSYARNNPIINFDPTGLYNIKTGQIEKGDTQEGIVNSINSALGVKTDWQTIYSVSFYHDRFGDKSLNDLVGQSLRIGTDVTANITDRLNQLNKERAVEASVFGKASLGLFAPQMPWDIKNSNDSILGRSANDRRYWSYVYNGELIRYDAPGNINFGYVARSLGLPSFVIQGSAVAEQIVDDAVRNRHITLKDNPGDSQYIKQGIDIYRDQLPWWKKIYPW